MSYIVFFTFMCIMSNFHHSTVEMCSCVIIGFMYITDLMHNKKISISVQLIKEKLYK